MTEFQVILNIRMGILYQANLGPIECEIEKKNGIVKQKVISYADAKLRLVDPRLI